MACPDNEILSCHKKGWQVPYAMRWNDIQDLSGKKKWTVYIQYSLAFTQN